LEAPETDALELLPPEAKELLLEAWAIDRVVTAGMEYAAATNPMRRSMLRRSRELEDVSVITIVHKVIKCGAFWADEYSSN